MNHKSVNLRNQQEIMKWKRKTDDGRYRRGMRLIAKEAKDGSLVSYGRLARN